MTRLNSLRLSSLLQYLVIFTLLSNLWHGKAVAATTERSTYIAAVYEHAVILHPDRRKAVSRAEALNLMNQNLDIYTEKARKAKQKGADILVFPEGGLYGMIFTRKAVFPYLEAVPDPEHVTWSPCSNPNRFPSSEVQHKLSCMAKNNSIYIVANMGDKVVCDSQKDKKCPKDGRYQYNTNVVYDLNGTLIAKYHKRNLFFEYQFDQPQAEAIYFETPFGCFGLLVCFDLLFEKPTLTLVTGHNVTDVLLPTAWMDALPLLPAIGYHSSFARGLGVNLLSANIHLPRRRFQGSGIYTPKGMANFYYNNSANSPSKLLVSEIEIVKQPSFLTSIENPVSKEKQTLFITESQKEKEFHEKLFADRYTFRLLEGLSGDIKVCDNKICCYLRYEIQEEDGKDKEKVDLFAFGAFDGLHTRSANYHLQVCTLVRCADSQKRSSCGDYTFNSSTVFKSLYIMSNFQTSYVYPQVILSNEGQLELSEATQWKFTGRSSAIKMIESEFGFDKPLLVATLLGRHYSRDDFIINSSHPTNLTDTDKRQQNGDSGHVIGVNIFYLICSSILGISHARGMSLL